MKTYGGAIGHRAMNVPPMLRTFVCKVFCALALTIPTITKTGGYFFVPTMHVSSVFFLLHGLCCCYAWLRHFYATWPSCFSQFQVCITGQLIQNWCTSAHGVPQKLQERLCDAMHRGSYIKKKRNSESTVASLPSIPWAVNFDGEKKTNKQIYKTTLWITVNFKFQIKKRKNARWLCVPLLNTASEVSVYVYQERFVNWVKLSCLGQLFVFILGKVSFEPKGVLKRSVQRIMKERAWLISYSINCKITLD